MCRVLASAALALLFASLSAADAPARPARGGFSAVPGGAHRLTPRPVQLRPRPLVPRALPAAAAHKPLFRHAPRHGTFSRHLNRHAVGLTLPLTTAATWIYVEAPPSAYIVPVEKPAPDPADAAPRRTITRIDSGPAEGGCRAEDVRVDGEHGPRTITIVRC